jgi:hypothetical protein
MTQGEKQGAARHICAFFNSRDEEYQALLPWIQEGLTNGEKVVQILDPARLDEHCSRMQDAGIDTNQMRGTRQLELRTYYEAYLASGSFAQEEMLALLPQLLSAPRDEGYPGSRITGQMEWSLEKVAGVEDLIEYEARATEIISQYDDPVICVYDISKYSAAFIMDVLRTHPMVIIGGVIQENPFYVPSPVFLEELKTRRAN